MLLFQAEMKLEIHVDICSLACCAGTVLRLYCTGSHLDIEWDVLPPEAILKPVVHARAEGHEWISGPNTPGAILLSVAHDTTTGHEKDCGLGCQLKPC